MHRLSAFLLSILLFGVLGLTPEGPHQIKAQNTAESRETVRWDGQSRFNILVMGQDRRPRDGLTDQVRTDAVFIVSYDPQNQRIGVLDIPRDIHIALIEGNGSLVPINTLVLRGENRAIGYGPYFAVENLQFNFGMYIDAFVMLDFQAFIEFIDAIGGITVDVPYTIYDGTFPDMNYGFDPFFVRAGVQTFDGYEALQYARTRHQDNDYLRGTRQLQVIEAVYERLREPAALRGLISNAQPLWNSVRDNVSSNMAPEHMIYIGTAMMEVPRENIITGSLNEQYSFNYTYRGNTVRVPDREQLPALLVAVFGETYFR